MLHDNYCVLASRNEEIRRDFISRLTNMGVDTASRSFEKDVDSCFNRYFENIQRISSDNMAIDIWKRSKRRSGATTRLAQSPNIILDGEVPGAESNKAFFEFVLFHGVPMVFKYAQSADAVQEEFINKDVHFTNILTQKYNNQLPPGLVNYTSFSIHKSDSAGTVSGSLSPHFPLTLHSLTSRPLPADYLLSVGHQVLDSINIVHSIDYSINDIKPSNLFIQSNGHVCIADYGGYTAMDAASLQEYSPEYMPEDLLSVRVCRKHDESCLASSLLELYSLKPIKITLSTLHRAANLVDHLELREFILSLLRY